MKAPLIKIKIHSIYGLKDKPADLPERMARCTPDTKKAIVNIKATLKKMGSDLILTDMFRSYDMQYQSHKDFSSGKKKAFSPPPGGSMHEGGRAFDLDLSKIKITLKEFWEIAAKESVHPIIGKPLSSKSEAWHFDCQGSHKIVYDYYASGKGLNMKPYAAMAASAILSIGVKVDQFAGKEREAFIQSALIRLGQNIGNIDGEVGPKTRSAMAALWVNASNWDVAVMFAESLLKKQFPQEYEIS